MFLLAPVALAAPAEGDGKREVCSDRLRLGWARVAYSGLGWEGLVLKLWFT